MKVKDQSAPGALDVIRLLVNTEDVANPDSDVLATAPGARAWLAEHGLLGAGDDLDVDELALVRGLRDALRLELLAHTGDADPAQSWAQLGEYADRAELGLRCGEGSGTIELVAEGQHAQRVIGRCFALIYDAIREGRWQRLKACRKSTCLWAFYDHSKNGSGHWCSMAVCGNRAKAQRRRTREAQAR